MEVAGRVLHGTCGWSDPSIVSCGRFYPGSAKTSAEKLEVHSRTFGCVEVDSSLYSIPSAFNVQKWVDSVPRGYVFHFKAFGLFCGSSQGCPTNALPRRVREQLAPHLLSKPTVTLKDLPQHAVKSIWAAFGACIEPAVKAKKMGCVVFQFPLSFLPSDTNRRHVEWCRSHVHRSLGMAVEFRARSWFIPDGSSTVEWLSGIDVALVAADELVHETLPSARHGAPANRPAPLMPIALQVAHPRFFYIRLHRRGVEAQNECREGKQERLLADSEHADWAARIDALRPQLQGPVYFLWGTDWEDAPVVNAKHLQAALPDACRFDWAKQVRRQTATKRNSLTSLLAGAAKKVAKVAQGRSSLPVGGSASLAAPHVPQGRASMPSVAVPGALIQGASTSCHELHNPSERASLAGTVAEQAQAQLPVEGCDELPVWGAAAQSGCPPQQESGGPHAQGLATLLAGSALATGARIPLGNKEVTPGSSSARQPVHAAAMLSSGDGTGSALASGVGDAPGGAQARATLLSGATCGSGSGRCAQPAAAPASASPLQPRDRAPVLPGGACAAAVGVGGGAAPGPGATPGGVQGAQGRAALLSSASASIAQLGAPACKIAKPGTALPARAATCGGAPKSAPPAAAAAYGKDSAAAARSRPVMLTERVTETPEKRASDILNATQCSTPELKPHSSQLSQSSIATPVTPQSPAARPTPPGTAAADCDAGQEQSGARGNGGRAGPPNLPGTSWFAAPMSERARGADVAADETADKPSVPDVPSHPISLATAAEWSAQVGPEAAADLDPRYMKPMDDSAGTELRTTSTQPHPRHSTSPGACTPQAVGAAQKKSCPQASMACMRAVAGRRSLSESKRRSCIDGQEAHTATTNLAHKFSKLVHKVPVGALESEKPLEQPTAASGSAGANCSRKDSAKSVVGAMDAFMKPKSTMHGPSDDSVATGATGVAAETAPHRSKGQELLEQAVAGRDVAQQGNALPSGGASKQSAAAAASVSGTNSAAAAGAIDKPQVKSSNKGDGGKTSGASRKGGSKASKAQGKAQEKSGGMRQATIGQLFGR